MKKIVEIVSPDGRICPVYSGLNPAATLAFLWEKRWRQAVVITDTNTGPLFSRKIAEAVRYKTDRTIELSFPAGEKNKNRRTKESLEDSMLAAGIDRTACIVAAGGGVTLDLAGFVAATYMRGIDHINIATSLLAQVDAAIGGKTGVDTPAGKNLVGAFHQPRAVLVDFEALNTLPEIELANGMAELVKHAVIADANLFADLERMPVPVNGSISESILDRSILIKAAVVQADERENGKRRILNFGHTVGHAIEMAMDYREPHGFCVATGMLVESMVAEIICGFPPFETHRLKSLISRLGLPFIPQADFESIAGYLSADKKNRAGGIHCALPKSLGQMDEAGGTWSLPVDPLLIKEVMLKLSSDGGKRCSA